MGHGLRGVTLRFAHEVRSETDYFIDIPEMKLPAEMMKLAQHYHQDEVWGLRRLHAGGSLPRRAGAHSPQKASEAPPASSSGEAHSAERRQLDGCAPPQHCR